MSERMQLASGQRKLWCYYLLLCALMCVLLLLACKVALAQAPEAGSSASNALYLNYKLPLDTRVADLVSRLTLDEKISLLGETEPAIPRLGIRAYHYGDEALHGVVRPGKFTVFPMSIGLASTWDRDLIREMTAAISDEARARYNADHGEMETGEPFHGLYNGLLTFWSPTINMARDPRWGRVAETYGEDPYLTSQLAVAFVHGLQGDNPRYLKVVSTPKHFAAYNEEFDRFAAQVNVSQQVLYEYYLPAFRAAIMEGGADSIMSSYNAIKGVPNSANHWLLTDLLRDKWKFKGYVVTDCGAVVGLFRGFHFAKTPEEAAAMALNAGVDLECGNVMQRNLAKALQDGMVTPASIDRAVANVLRSKFRLGMFDPPGMVPYSSISSDVIGSSAHLQLALRAAQESLVLLRNAPYRGKPVLPLNRNAVHSIAVVGPYAAVAELGDYSGIPIHDPVTPLQGIRSEAGSAVSIRYIPFAKPAADQAANNKQLFAQEAEAARTSDVTIAFLGFGTDSAMEGKDRMDLDLSADQQELIREVVAANPRTIVVLINGGPVTIAWISEHVPALVEAWYPGEEGGTAIADVLFGSVNPSGHLPVTFYRSVDQLPDFHDYEIAHGRTYQYFRGNPLYAFGFGLSYTRFAYSRLAIDKAIASPGDVLHATVDVTNRGALDGVEVVQLYVHQDNALPDPPIRKLVSFRRVAIPQGKTETVRLDLPVESLKVYSPERKGFVLAPGNVTLEVGGSSGDIRTSGKLLIESPQMQAQ